MNAELIGSAATQYLGLAWSHKCESFLERYEFLGILYPGAKIDVMSPAWTYGPALEVALLLFGINIGINGFELLIPATMWYSITTMELLV